MNKNYACILALIAICCCCSCSESDTSDELKDDYKVVYIQETKELIQEPTLSSSGVAEDSSYVEVDFSDSGYDITITGTPKSTLAIADSIPQDTTDKETLVDIDLPTDSLEEAFNEIDELLVSKGTDKASIFNASTVSDNYLLGKFSPSKNNDFAKIALPYGNKEGMYLRKDAYQAFIQMHEAAKNDGISLTILSSTRTFYQQKRIWERKWTGKTRVDGKNLATAVPFAAERAYKILEFSSMPGTSRHHWGTDIDINSLENKYFEKGKGLKEYQWLQKNAPNFGFCQVYTAKDESRPKGYNEEKWHWSYIPVSAPLTREYLRRITEKSLTGFEGAETAKEINIIIEYVWGICESCK